MTVPELTLRLGVVRGLLGVVIVLDPLSGALLRTRDLDENLARVAGCDVGDGLLIPDLDAAEAPSHISTLCASIRGGRH